jgi:SAM-dependent methyltransferase
MNFSECPKRKYLAKEFLRNDGIEIGPLHSAWPVDNVRVQYVDRYSRSELIQQYPELNASQIAMTDVIDDGRYLYKFADNSVGFIINSHVLEHCSNPIAALHRWHQVIRPGGILLMAIPDGDHTFDKKRPLTTPYEFLLIDKGNQTVLEQLIREHFTLSENEPERTTEEVEDLVSKCIAEDFHIHFPVWNGNTFLAFVSVVNEEFGNREKGLQPFKVECFMSNGFEFLIALRVQHEFKR